MRTEALRRIARHEFTRAKEISSLAVSMGDPRYGVPFHCQVAVAADASSRAAVAKRLMRRYLQSLNPHAS
jgi:hypothetical protein